MDDRMSQPPSASQDVIERLSETTGWQLFCLLPRHVSMRGRMLTLPTVAEIELPSIHATFRE